MHMSHGMNKPNLSFLFKNYFAEVTVGVEYHLKTWIYTRYKDTDGQFFKEWTFLLTHHT